MQYPSKAHMLMTLRGRNPVELNSLGAAEAPSMSTKMHISPDRSTGGLPIGGVDMMSNQPGQQLMPQIQPTQGQQPAQQPQQQGMPPQPPRAMPQPQQAPQAQQGQSNILQMTPQGRAMGALMPMQQAQQLPQGLKDGGAAKAQNADEFFSRLPARLKDQIIAAIQNGLGLQSPNLDQMRLALTKKAK